MVTEVGEIRAVRDLMQKEVQHLSKFGHQLPKRLQFGAMLEVPALMWQLEELMEEVDFVSVGSNDLFQFSMAADRGNARVSDRFDVLGRPFLRILRDIVRAADKSETPVTLCGEMAGKPLSAMALLGIGFRSISIAPTAIGPVKAMLLALDVDRLSRELNAALDDHRTSFAAEGYPDGLCGRQQYSSLNPRTWSEWWRSFLSRKCANSNAVSARSRHACRLGRPRMSM